MRALQLAICLQSSDDIHLSTSTQHQSFKLPNRTKQENCTANNNNADNVNIQIYTQQITHTKKQIFRKAQSSVDQMLVRKFLIDDNEHVIYVNISYASA